LIAPILCFTAEEIWQYLPGEKEDSVHLALWPEAKEEYLDGSLAAKWQDMLAVREQVTRSLEELRQKKEIRSSLEARVDLFAAGGTLERLIPFRDDLAELFIVSQCFLHPVEDGKELEIKISRADGEKCPRCWIYAKEKGQEAELCRRCAGVMENLEA
jgi:isoleucyl-tRNA synthetase